MSTQKNYLAGLLGNDKGDAATDAPSPSPARGSDTRPASRAGLSLLGRENALARVASGEVRQVTQLLLDPDRVRVWPGNARSYAHLTEENCRDLIDSIIAEGGQKVPAIVRRIEGDPAHDYEVIAGTRRHWSIRWLRAHSYPDVRFVAQVAELDDEAAFRLADLENRARKDVSDLERARNYAAALETHYGGHLTRMAERLKLSKGWLSKMLKVAALPDKVIEAFASPSDVQLQPAYPLAQAYGDETRRARIERNAVAVASAQHNRRVTGAQPMPPGDVIRALLDIGKAEKAPHQPIVVAEDGRLSLSVRSFNRHGATVRIHNGHGLTRRQLIQAFAELLDQLEETTGGIGQ